jgi:hypothetical protein
MFNTASTSKTGFICKPISINEKVDIINEANTYPSVFCTKIAKQIGITALTLNTVMTAPLFFFWGWGETVHLVHWPPTGLLYQPQMIDEYGAFGGIRIGRRNQSTWRKPALVPPCPPQILHD